MSYTCDTCGKEFETPIMVESSGEYGGIAHKEPASPCCKSGFDETEKLSNEAQNQALPLTFRSRFVSLTDLIDVIHYTIIKHRGGNIVALEEIQRLEWLIKGSKELENYSVEETELWQSIMRQRNGC